MSTADDYKPGDVATDPAAANADSLARRFLRDAGWYEEPGLPTSAVTRICRATVRAIGEAELLLTPDERAVPKGGVHLTEADAERLVSVMAAHRWTGLDDEAADDMRAVIRSLAAAQSEPPLEEPGLWGVVEAGAPALGEQRLLWAYHPGGWWRTGAEGVGGRGWDDLIEPTLVRPGIDDEGAAS